MGHSKIYNNSSAYVIANVMDDVENVDAKDFFIDFHAKSIYPAIEEIVLRDKSLDKIYKDPITIALASKKCAEEQIRKAASLELPENIKLLFEVTKRVYFIGNERMLIAHDSNRLRFS